MDSVKAHRFATEYKGEQIGGWTIDNYKGHGSSAVVLSASRNNDSCALKVYDSDLVERFGRDQQLGRIQRQLELAGHNHPNLVKILAGGECPATGFLYLVMQNVESPALSELLADIPRTDIRRIVSQIASAAQYLEGLGIAHRDIKPDNVSYDVSAHHAVLLDLGVIRPHGISDLTGEDEKVFLGTLRYSSPEYLFRTEEDTLEGWRALTFYQIGAVLHDLIMRVRLFSDRDQPYARLVDAVKYGVPQITADHTDPNLILLAKNTLVKDPGRRLRFVSWDDFADSPIDVSPVTQATARTRKRASMAEHNRVLAGDINGERDRHEHRVLLESLCMEISNSIRTTCIGDSAFPPLTLASPISTESGEVLILLTFLSSPPHFLFHNLHVWFCLELLEPTAPSVNFSVVAALSGSQSPSYMPDKAFSYVQYSGVFDEPSAKALVRETLFLVLDKAQCDAESDDRLVIRDPYWLVSTPQSGE